MERRDPIGARGTRILAPLIVVLGVAIVIRTVTAGGGPASIGVILGLVFVGIGIGRLYLLRQAASRPPG
jgi:hypothetical protein